MEHKNRVAAKATSTNVLWISNCSACTSQWRHSHAHGGRTMQQRAAGGMTAAIYDGRHLESMMSYQKSYSFNWCVFTCIAEQSCQISSRSHMKRQSLRLFEQRRPNKQKEEEQVAW